jgi:hypothetical protein
MKPQTYANHRAIPHPAYGLAGVAILAWAGSQVWLAISHPSVSAWLAAVGTSALLVVWYTARRSAQITQDRIIRLEMQLRLARLMPGRELGALTLAHVIALRFASDAELPALVERTLAGEFANGDAIKRAITGWQADWLRV